MRRLERRVSAASAALDRIFSAIAFGALFVMLGAILLQVVARYVFRMPPAWTEELGRYAMIWAAMCGATMAYFRRADPALVAASPDAPPGRALLTQAVESVAILMFALPVLWFTPGWLERRAHRITESLQWNSAIVVAVIPASLIVICVHMSARLLRALCAYRDRAR